VNNVVYYDILHQMRRSDKKVSEVVFRYHSYTYNGITLKWLGKTQLSLARGQENIEGRIKKL